MSHGGRPSVSAQPALAHADHLVSTCPSVTLAHVGRLAGVGSGTLHRARKSGRMEQETIDRILAVTRQHVRLSPPPFIPSTYARKHVEGLARETGLSLGAIGRAVKGASFQTIYNVAGPGKPPRMIKYAIHAAILATTVDDVRAVDFWCDRSQSITRLRALQANGWGLTPLSVVYGMNLTNLVVQPLDSPMEVPVAREIERIYREIGDRPGNSVRAARHAERLGYKPPIYYDEDMNLIPDVEVDEEGVAARDKARDTLCVLGMTLEGAPASRVVEVHDGDKRRVALIRRTYGIRMERRMDGSYYPVDIKPGALDAVRLAVRHVDYRTPVDALDKPDLDYQGLLAAINAPKAAAAA